MTHLWKRWCRATGCVCVSVCALNTSAALGMKGIEKRKGKERRVPFSLPFLPCSPVSTRWPRPSAAMGQPTRHMVNTGHETGVSSLLHRSHGFHDIQRLWWHFLFFLQNDIKGEYHGNAKNITNNAPVQILLSRTATSSYQGYPGETLLTAFNIQYSCSFSALSCDS